MKKKKLLQIRWGILITLLSILLPFCLGHVEDRVLAQELTQSSDRVSVDLTHQHADNVCSDVIWVSCGGIWKTHDEPSRDYRTVYFCSNYHSNEISNGVVLSSIHQEWEETYQYGIHYGENVRTTTCSVTSCGTLVVQKNSTEEGEVLTAFLENAEDMVINPSYVWTYPDGTTFDGEEIVLNQNGKYYVNLTWTDAKTGVERQTKLEYIDLSRPISICINLGNENKYEWTGAYGDGLPDMEIPVREGYIFRGIRMGDVLWYDEDGHANADVHFTDSVISYEPVVLWEAKKYLVYYGDDEDGDGIRDNNILVEYDQPYGPIDPGEERDGYSFEGYYFGTDRIFDGNGNGQGVWHFDVTESIELETVYREVPKPASPAISDNGNHSSQESTSQQNDRNHSSDINQAQNPVNTVSSNSVSDNSVSDNSVSDNSVSDNSVSDNSILEHPDSDDSSRDSGNGEGQSQNHNSSENQTNEADSNGDENVSTENENPGFEESDRNNDYMNERERVNQEYIEVEIPERNSNAEAMPPEILNHGANKVTPQKVVAVAGITAGILGLVYLLIWLYLSRTLLTHIYSIKADGKEVLAGDAVVIREQNIFYMNVKKSVIEKGETGRFRVVFTKYFRKKYKNQEIIIRTPKGKMVEVIGSDIVIEAD